MKKNGIALLLLCLNNALYPQTFSKFFNGNSNDIAYSIIQTPDSSYVMTGSTNSYGAGLADVFLLKVSKEGEMQWSKTYGGIKDDVGKSLKLTKDNGFIVCGYTNSFSPEFDDLYLIKTDSVGNIEWSKTYGDSSSEKGNSVIEMKDGSYIACGYSFSYGLGSSDIFLVRADSNGNFISSNIYGNTGYEEAYSIKNTNDGGFILAGLTTSFGAGNEDFNLLKFDNKGQLSWTSAYGGKYWDRCFSVIQTSDSGFAFCGITQSFSNQLSCFSTDQYYLHYDFKSYLIKTNKDGIVTWSKAYGVMNNENVPYSLIQTSDAGFCMAGYSEPLTGGDYRCYIVKTDSSGTLKWSKTYGDGSVSYAYDILQTYDNDLVICGVSNGFDKSNSDTKIYLLKTDMNGLSSCHDSLVTTLFKDTIPDYTTNSISVLSPNSQQGDSTQYITASFSDSLLCWQPCNIILTFAVSDSSVCVGDSVIFNSSLVNAITTEWKIDEIFLSNQPNTSFIFSSLGTHYVSLIVYNGYCFDTAMASVFVNPKTTAGFGYNDSGLTISFYDSSLYVQDWSWDFGDGASDTAQNPIHAYAGNGSYIVCLTVANNCNIDTLCKNIFIGDNNLASYNRETESLISVYPNPFNNYSMVVINELDLFKDYGDILFILYDIKGNEVLKNGFSQNKKYFLINSTDMPAGVYYFVISCREQILKSDKLVIF